MRGGTEVRPRICSAGTSGREVDSPLSHPQRRCDRSAEACLAGLGRINVDTFHVARDGGEVSDSSLRDLGQRLIPVHGQDGGEACLGSARASTFIALAARVRVC